MNSEDSLEWRPYVLLNCAMSLDGYLDDASATRLVLSGPEDLDRVDELRAGSDAILVGAGTVRADNPRLLVRSQARREARVARGAVPDPVKVTVTGSGALDPGASFFTTGAAAKIVYVGSGALERTRQRLGSLAELVDAGAPLDLHRVLGDLRERGVERLLVEGGGSILTQFLTGALADELRVAVAPFFVGDGKAPRMAGEGDYPWDSRHHARLVRVSQVGQDAVLEYALSPRCAPGER